MTPEQFQRLEMLYDRAAALPEGERARFIEEQCAGDEELRRELMAAFGNAGSGLTGVVKLAAAAASGSGEHWTAQPGEEARSARPSRIGPYELIEEIGRGAMGVVFRAFDPAIGRAVAIKIIRSDPFAPPVEKEELRRRFSREAGAAGKLSHPGIVTIFHLGSDGDHEYMVMELVAGQCLEKLLVPGAPVDVPRSAGILRQLARALDYAHSQGVIHRDIKPANILVSLDGTVKIGDFGIARIVSSTMTQTGAVLGTPSYMAPEQIMARKVGARADQFSLAVLAYQMLTGRRPFEASSTHELMYQILHAEPQPARDANPALPAGAEDVFQRALSKDPDQRYGSCVEFVSALEEQLAGIAQHVSEAPAKPEAVVRSNAPAAPPDAPQFVPPEKPAWWKEHRVLAAAVLGACPALALALFLAWTHVPAKPAPTEAEPVRDAGAPPSRGSRSPVPSTESNRPSGGGSSPAADPAAVFATGLGPFHFGMQPSQVLEIVKGWNLWKGDSSAITFITLQKAEEYEPADVRFLFYSLGQMPAPSAPGSAMRSMAALEPCWGGTSNLSLMFSSDGLFKLMLRLGEDCTDRVKLLTQWAAQYAVSPTGSTGHLQFRKTVRSAVLEGHRVRTIVNVEIYKSGSPLASEAWWLGEEKPVSKPAPDAEKKYALGMQLLNQKDYKGSIGPLTEAISLNPNFAEAYAARCEARQDVMLVDEAMEDCDRAIKLKPNYPEAFVKRGWVKIRKNEPDQAVEDFSEAIRLNPEFYDAYFARGAAVPRPPDPIADLTQAIRLKPKDPVAYFWRAQHLVAEREYERAIQDLDEAIRLWPAAYYWRYRGDVYRTQGKYQRAIEDYDEDLRRHPNDVPGYQGRAAAKESLGDKAGAAADRKRGEELKSAK